VKVPETPAVKTTETPAAMKPAAAAAAAMKPAAAAVAAASPKPAVSDSIGRQCEQSGSDNTGQKKLHFHKASPLLLYIRLFAARIH
jgi:hypothetical protein